MKGWLSARLRPSLATSPSSVTSSPSSVPSTSADSSPTGTPPPPAKAIDRITPELWLVILRFLSPGLPRPLSGLTRSEGIGEDEEVVLQLPADGAPGTTSRRDIRAPGLAAMMRVSSRMNHLASEVLYHRVICDNLGSLFAFDTNRPAHPLVQSKGVLLRRIRYLHLEYRRKCPDDQTYQDIMVDGHADRMQQALEIALIEASEVTRWMTEFQHIIGNSTFPARHRDTRPNRFRALFGRSPLSPPPPLLPSRLTHVTVGAIFGGQDGMWNTHAPPPDDVFFTADSHPSFCRLFISRWCTLWTFETLPDLSHLCLRGTAGPLALPNAFTWLYYRRPFPLPAPLFTIHFGMRTHALTAAVGRPTRWLYEHSGNDNVCEDVYINLLRGIQRTRSERQLLESQGVLSATMGGFELDIRASGNLMPDGAPMDAAQQRRAAAELGESLNRDAGPQERFTVQASVDSPCCEACGWVYTQGPLEGVVIGEGSAEADVD